MIDRYTDDYLKKTFNFELGKGIEKTEGLFECPCCYDEYPNESVTEMNDCGHKLCSDCFKDYIKSRLLLGTDVVLTTCPDQECKNIVPDHVIRKFLTKAELEKYSYFVQKSFVDITQTARWCPGKDCKYIIDYRLAEAIDIRCDCGHYFCHGCSKTGHMPIDCETLQTWLDRISKGDEDSENWIKINTKACPKCMNVIEKN